MSTFSRRQLLRLAALPALGALLPRVSFAQEATWAVTLEDTVLRSWPTEGALVFGPIPQSSYLQVLGYQGVWANVRDPRTGGTAFVESALLGESDPPGRYVILPRPAVRESLEARGLLTESVALMVYPTPAPEAEVRALRVGSRVDLLGVVKGEDDADWYLTADGAYLPASTVFVAEAVERFPGRWLHTTLLPRTQVTAYEGNEAVRSFPAIRGIDGWLTPTGTFYIQRRVANETMNSETIGIPRNAPGGYYLQNVLYTQYFLPTGESLHYNYWSSNFGGAGSHGCLGLRLDDSSFLWEWATIGTPIVIQA